MSDSGPTAIQVSPTEAEMSKLSSFFHAAADAIVNASTLKTKVEDLSHTLDVAVNAKNEIEGRYNTLIDELHTVRAELEQAKSAAKRWQDEAEARQRDWQTEVAMNTDLQGKLQSEQSAHADTKRDRDDHALRAMQLEDDLGKAQATLKEFHEKLAGMFAGAGVSAPTPPTMPTPMPVIEHPPQPEPQPDPAPAERDGWAPGYSWNSAKGKYVKDGEPASF